MSTVNEIVTRFSFVGSLKPAENFNANLKSSIGLVAGMAAGLQAATGFMINWTSSVTKAIDPMVQLSRETSVSIAAIQELGFAASQNGSDLNAVQSSIKELNKRMGEFSRTASGPAAEAIYQLGLRTRDANGQMKTADKVLLDVRDKLQGFSSAEQADLLDKLGIDSSLIQLLNQSGSAIDSLRSKAQALGTITKEQGDAATALNDANTVLRFGFTGLKNQIAVGLAPAITDITNGFVNFLIANKDLIQNGIKRLGEILLATSGMITRMTPIALGAAAAFGVWKVATIGLGTALKTVFTPITAIVGVIVPIVLAIDALIVAFNGGDSAIRGWILSWTGFDITPALQNAVKAIGKFVSKAMEWFGVLKDFVSEIFNSISDTISGVFTAISDISGSVGDFFGMSGGASGTIDNGIGKAGASAKINQENTYNIYTNDGDVAGRTAAGMTDQNLRETREYFDRGGM